MQNLLNDLIIYFFNSLLLLSHQWFIRNIIASAIYQMMKFWNTYHGMKFLFIPENFIGSGVLHQCNDVYVFVYLSR